MAQLRALLGDRRGAEGLLLMLSDWPMLLGLFAGMWFAGYARWHGIRNAAKIEAQVAAARARQAQTRKPHARVERYCVGHGDVARSLAWTEDGRYLCSDCRSDRRVMVEGQQIQRPRRLSNW